MIRTVKSCVSAEGIANAHSIISKERVVGLSLIHYPSTNKVSLVMATTNTAFVDAPRSQEDCLLLAQRIVNPETTQLVTYDTLNTNSESKSNILVLEPLLKLVDFSWNLQDGVLHLCHYKLDATVIACCPVEMMSAVKQAFGCRDIALSIQRTLVLTSDCEIMTPPDTPPLPRVHPSGFRPATLPPPPSLYPPSLYPPSLHPPLNQPTTTLVQPLANLNISNGYDTQLTDAEKIERAAKWLESRPGCQTADAATHALLNSYAPWAGTTHQQAVRHLAHKAALRFVCKGDEHNSNNNINNSSNAAQMRISDDVVIRASKLLRNTHPVDAERRRDRLINQLFNSLGNIPVPHEAKHQYLEQLLNILVQQGVLKVVNETQLAVAPYPKR